MNIKYDPDCYMCDEGFDEDGERCKHCSLYDDILIELFQVMLYGKEPEPHYRNLFKHDDK